MCLQLQLFINRSANIRTNFGYNSLLLDVTPVGTLAPDYQVTPLAALYLFGLVPVFPEVNDCSARLVRIVHIPIVFFAVEDQIAA